MLQITAVVIATAVKFCHLWPVKLFSLFLSLLDMTLLESLIASLFHRISSITKQYNNITMSIQLLPQTLNQPYVQETLVYFNWKQHSDITWVLGVLISSELVTLGLL